ncbi:MAG: DNA polymerase III subunit gamma/tau, partial [Pseudomonadota bacterium]
MDAASRTGVGDVREIIDSVAYRAASARYKIYIIDEVHMLSNSAFNALLKTLEEPPEHVKFIFATTEIRKVPVTVLSRCQRFDLRRIEPEVMVDLLRKIAGAEGAAITDDALGLITRAAEGSARDATSILDQAIAHGAGETQADDIRALLGLADRGRVLDVFDMVLKGDASGALQELGAQYADGADPAAVLKDLAEIAHWISVIKITPQAAQDPTIGPDERMRGTAMADALPMRVLTRMWQMLLTAMEEVGRAPNAMMAAEMALIRLTHVADLPSPEDLVRKLKDMPVPPPTSGGMQTPNPASPAPTQAAAPAHAAAPVSASRPSGSGKVQAVAADPAQALARFARFEDVLELIRHHRDVKLIVDIETSARLISYAPGRIEFEPTETAPPDLAQRLGTRLQTWTGNRWAVSIGQNGGPTIAETRDAKKNALTAVATDHPMVQAVFQAFPNAKIVEIRTQQDIAADAHTDALPEVDEEWDPFDDDG